MDAEHSQGAAAVHDANCDLECRLSCLAMSVATMPVADFAAMQAQAVVTHAEASSAVPCQRATTHFRPPAIA